MIASILSCCGKRKSIETYLSSWITFSLSLSPDYFPTPGFEICPDRTPRKTPDDGEQRWRLLPPYPTYGRHTTVLFILLFLYLLIYFFFVKKYTHLLLRWLFGSVIVAEYPAINHDLIPVSSDTHDHFEPDGYFFGFSFDFSAFIIVVVLFFFFSSFGPATGQ